jgi:hypothetical protein
MPDTDPQQPAAPAPQPAQAAGAQTTLPPEGQQSGAQVLNNWLGAAGVLGFGPGMILCGAGSPLLSGAGGSWANPCGISGWGAAGFGGPTIGTYRLMLQHPTIRHVRANVFAPIKDSQWTVERAEEKEQVEQEQAADPMDPAGRQPPTDGAEDPDAGPADPPTPGALPPEPPQPNDPIDEAVKFVQKVMDGLRPKLVPHALRGLDYGHAPFEIVWGHDPRGYYTITVAKPLAVSSFPLTGYAGAVAYTEIEDDDFGNLKTLRNVGVKGGAKGATVELHVADRKAWLYTYDGETGNLRGRSILENIRETAWLDWLDARQQLQSLGFKIAGRQAYAVVPPGGYEHPVTGEFRTFAQDAADGLTAFVHGKQPIFIRPAVEGMADDVKQVTSGTPLVSFEVVDFGDQAPFAASLLNRMAAAERMMFSGYLCSPRTGMEAEHGSRADAAEHRDGGIQISQAIANDLAQQAQVLVDWLAEINFGLPHGTLVIKNAPLVDTRKSAYLDVIKGLLFNQQFQNEAVHTLDVDKMLDSLDFPRLANFREVLFDLKAMQAQQSALQAQQPPAGGDGAGEGDEGDDGPPNGPPQQPPTPALPPPAAA